MSDRWLQLSDDFNMYILSSVRDSPVNVKWASTRIIHVSYVNLHHKNSVKLFEVFSKALKYSYVT